MTTLLLDDYLPRYVLRQVDRIAVEADPERAWIAARTIDLYQVGFVRWLFELRGLPERLAGLLRGLPVPPAPGSRIDDIAAGGSGFQILGEDHGREVVVGAIGKFWQPKIEWARVAAAGFAGFDRPGFGKVAWCLRVDPRPGGGAWVSVEVRVDATDEVARRRFRRYWRLIGPFSHAIRRAVLHELRRELGPAPDEESLPLPGDTLLADASAQRTDSITIDAPPAQVWPWLVQMGCRRGGWYSFDRLDNGGRPSARRIVPELQHLRPGDALPATPDDEGGFAVLRAEPPHVLVLGSPDLSPSPPGRAVPWGMMGLRYRMTWAFVLEPIGASATRLLVRVRAELAPGLRATLTRPALLSLHAFMEHEQLRNLKRRAEGQVS